MNARAGLTCVPWQTDQVTPGTESERPKPQPLLSGRQVAKLLGACPATIHQMRERGELRDFRVRNAIRARAQAQPTWVCRVASASYRREPR